MEPVITPTLRDYVHLVLGLQVTPISGPAIAHVLGIADRAQVSKALRQLESAGLAQRQPGRGNQPGGGRVADRWTASE